MADSILARSARPSWSRSPVAAVLLSLGLWAGGPGPAAAAETSGPLLALESFRLDNGMTFVVVRRPGTPSVAAGWVVSEGSASDPAGRSGLAHLLEHLLFKGTGTIRAGELDLLYAEAGANGLNALTRRDLTAYFVSLPVEKLELWFWLESDRLLAPAFRGLEAERGVVAQERRLRVDSDPTGLLEEELDRRLWGGHPYALPPSGEPAELDAIGDDDVRRFFESSYGPANLTAVLVGDVDPPAVRGLAGRYFGRLEGGPPARGAQGRGLGGGAARGAAGEGQPARRAPGPLVSSTLETICDCRTQARLLYRAPAFAAPDAAAIDVLVSVLNGRSGRLHGSLVLDQEIAFAAFANRQGLREAGRLSLVAEAKGEATARALLAALDAEIAGLLSRPPDPRELAKARNRLKADSVRALEEPSQLMLRLLLNAGLGRPERLNEWMSEVAAVSADDVARVSRELLGAGAPRVVGLFSRAGG
jgi:zinc protease